MSSSTSARNEVPKSTRASAQTEVCRIKTTATENRGGAKVVIGDWRPMPAAGLVRRHICSKVVSTVRLYSRPRRRRLEEAAVHARWLWRMVRRVASTQSRARTGEQCQHILSVSFVTISSSTRQHLLNCKPGSKSICGILVRSTVQIVSKR